MIQHGLNDNWIWPTDYWIQPNDDSNDPMMIGLSRIMIRLGQNYDWIWLNNDGTWPTYD